MSINTKQTFRNIYDYILRIGNFVTPKEYLQREVLIKLNRDPLENTDLVRSVMPGARFEVIGFPLDDRGFECVALHTSSDPPLTLVISVHDIHTKFKTIV